jgi:hypothetical protein
MMFLSQVVTENPSMIPTELISLIGGSAVGFIFRHMAEKRQAEKEMFERLMASNERTNKNQNEATKRVPIDIGKGVRQIIVLAILFGTIIAPFVLPFFGIPTVVEVIDKNPEILFGLIPETTNTVFQDVNGYLFTQENRQILLSIVGFYFGSAAAGNKT